MPEAIAEKLIYMSGTCTKASGARDTGCQGGSNGQEGLCQFSSTLLAQVQGFRIAAAMGCGASASSVEYSTMPLSNAVSVSLEELTELPQHESERLYAIACSPRRPQ